MYPHKIAKEIVELLVNTHARAWELISLTFYIPIEGLILLFQKDQKIWNNFKYALSKVTPRLASMEDWTTYEQSIAEQEPILRAELLSYPGIRAFVEWCTHQGMHTDDLDLFRFNKRPYSSFFAPKF